MGLPRTVSETDGDFCRKSQKFPNHLLFCAPAEGVPALGVKNWNGEATGPRKKFDDIFSRLYTIYTNVTDGQTPGTAKTALTHSVAQ